MIGGELNVVERHGPSSPRWRRAWIRLRAREVEPVWRQARSRAFSTADIAEVWRRGTVIGSWLLDLTATALAKEPQLAVYGGRVFSSSEGCRPIEAAIDEGVPTHVLGAAPDERFASRGCCDLAAQLLSAMRHEFGGHIEKPAKGGAR